MNNLQKSRWSSTRISVFKEIFIKIEDRVVKITATKNSDASIKDRWRLSYLGSDFKSFSDDCRTKIETQVRIWVNLKNDSEKTLKQELPKFVNKIKKYYKNLKRQRQ